jgi:hypothetical protein
VRRPGIRIAPITIRREELCAGQRLVQAVDHTLPDLRQMVVRVTVILREKLGPSGPSKSLFVDSTSRFGAASITTIGRIAGGAWKDEHPTGSLLFL